MSKGGKKLFKQLSKAFDSTGSGGGGDLGSSWRGNASGRRSGSARSGIGAGGERPKMVKRSSMQALTIDKARDLVDESDDEGSVIGEEENSEVSDKCIDRDTRRRCMCLSLQNTVQESRFLVHRALHLFD